MYNLIIIKIVIKNIVKHLKKLYIKKYLNKENKDVNFMLKNNFKS